MTPQHLGNPATHAGSSAGLGPSRGLGSPQIDTHSVPFDGAATSLGSDCKWNAEQGDYYRYTYNRGMMPEVSLALYASC